MPTMPKPPATRQRRNRSSTAATLKRVPGLKAPDLPERERGWHELTRTWWADVWASPMAPEYDDSDRHGLFMLADLVDAYWQEESPRGRAVLAGEIRLQRQCFGLTPIDRRRLQWEVERTDEAQDRGRRRRTASATGKQSKDDPRVVLQGVS